MRIPQIFTLIQEKSQYQAADAGECLHSEKDSFHGLLILR